MIMQDSQTRRIVEVLIHIIGWGIVFVTFRYWRFNPSMIFVVYIMRLISLENWKKELTSSQLFSQLLIAYAYFFPHFSFMFSSSVKAAVSFGALYTSLQSEENYYRTL